MGRAFEFRKERKFKRWGNMSKVFTRLGKEITMTAKSGGTDPDNNPRLRTIIASARSENMPKDNIDRAIKRAIEKDTSDYKEVIYEGYGPHGVAFLVETATDNTTRTVANVRSYFNKNGGSLGTSGSVEFMFEHKCVFKVKALEEIDIEELEFELIDFGADEVFADEDEIAVYGMFESFGAIQKYIESNPKLELKSGGFERIPTVELKTLPQDQKAELEKLIERFENDDDVQNVYHTMSLF